MRIRLGTLRRVLKEVAVSASVFKNNKPVRNPTDKQAIMKAVHDLESAFRRNLEMNLVVAQADKYNEQSSEFDDAAYEKVKSATASAVESLMSQVNSALEKSWVKAHQEAKGATETMQKPTKTGAQAPS